MQAMNSLKRILFSPFAYAAVVLAAIVSSIALPQWAGVWVIVVVAYSCGFLTLRLRTVLRRIGMESRRSTDVTQAAISDVREKQSRHEWIQEQALDRIDRKVGFIEALGIRAGKPSEATREIVFMSSNGAGAGHLARLMAIANQFDGPQAFFSLSKAYRVVSTSSHTVTYFPSHESVGGDRSVWGRRFQLALENELTKQNASMLVFDGTFVYPEVTATCRALGVPLVWVQRGSWTQEADAKSVQRHNAATVASAVILPGDVAVTESVELGANIEYVTVGPITLADASGSPNREDALRDLGLNTDYKYVLIQLGAGIINDIQRLENQAIQMVNGMGSDWVPVVTRSPLREADGAPEEEAVSISAFPIARYFRAFEFGVFAAGYNAVQEAVELDLPSVFVPNFNTKTDDQYRRAQGASQRGLGYVATSHDELALAMQELFDHEKRSELREALRQVPPSQGAVQAANFLRQLDNKYRYGSSTLDA